MKREIINKKQLVISLKIRAVVFYAAVFLLYLCSKENIDIVVSLAQYQGVYAFLL